MKKFIVILVLSLVLCGCGKEELSEVEKLMKENDYIIIDVRTADEYNSGHVVDAINIPYDQINDKIDISKDKLIFVYCKSGKRSQIAYQTLIGLGYDVYDLGAYNNIDLKKVK